MAVRIRGGTIVTGDRSYRADGVRHRGGAPIRDDVVCARPRRGLHISAVADGQLGCWEALSDPSSGRRGTRRVEP